MGTNGAWNLRMGSFFFVLRFEYFSEPKKERKEGEEEKGRMEREGGINEIIRVSERSTLKSSAMELCQNININSMITEL